MHAAAGLRRTGSRSRQIDELQASLEQQRQARLGAEDSFKSCEDLAQSDEDDYVVRRQSTFRLSGAPLRVLLCFESVAPAHGGMASVLLTRARSLCRLVRPDQ